MNPQCGQDDQWDKYGYKLMDINRMECPHHWLFIVNYRWEDDPIQLYGTGRPVDPSERPVGSGNAE